jgi:methyl-accepting chemotaxis protein
MSNSFPDDLAAQIRQIQDSVEAVNALRHSVQSASDELRVAGRASVDTMQRLDDISLHTAQVLDRVASTGQAIDEIKNETGTTLAELTIGLKDATSALEQSVRGMSDGVTFLPDVLRRLQESDSAIQDSLQAVLRELADLQRSTFESQKVSNAAVQDGLQAVLRDFADLQRSTMESRDAIGSDGFLKRIDYLIPSTIAGLIAGLAILELEGAKTFGLVAFTLLPAAIGISAKAEWKKLVKFAESHRK